VATDLGYLSAMPRRPRIHLPGIPQHIIQRGVDRQPVFFAEADFRFYLDWLKVKGVRPLFWFLILRLCRRERKKNKATNRDESAYHLGRMYVDSKKMAFKRSISQLEEKKGVRPL